MTVNFVEKRTRDGIGGLFDPIEMQALNVLPMPVLVVGEEQAIVYANMAAEDFFNRAWRC